MGKLTAFLAGLVFGLGLLLAGMANPAKVLNFFDVAGTWDASLALVMGAALLVTAIGGQGHIIGRGNQQISPRVLGAIGLEHLRVVATKRKLATLAGRPLLVDSGDPQLDSVFPDAIRVWTGYQEELLYPLGWSVEHLAAADEGAEACGNK